jgi:peptide deformylase
MIKPICRMGHPVLRKKALLTPREFIYSDGFSLLLEDLKDSMKHYGGIGIAAPQIGIDFQVAIIELMGFNRYGEDINFPMTVFINPQITFLTEEKQGFWEGCLSVPGLRGFVERPRKITVNYLDHKGEEKEIQAEGFLATVIQHELDHLEGILYIDRIQDTRLLSYQEEFDQFIMQRTLD